MFALIPLIARGLAGVIFSGAAVVTSLGFLNKSKQEPSPADNRITEFQLGKLAIYGLGIFLAYKLILGVLK